METTFTVTGMTCGHCASSVTEEITKIDGVTGVEVDVASGLVTVASTTTPDSAAVAAAVEDRKSVV